MNGILGAVICLLVILVAIGMLVKTDRRNHR